MADESFLNLLLVIFFALVTIGGLFCLIIGQLPSLPNKPRQ